MEGKEVILYHKVGNFRPTKVGKSKPPLTVLNIECDKDHFHMIFKSKPTFDIPKYINAVKTISSREIRRKFPEVKQLLWKDAFWSRSYFLATTGQVTLDVLKRYVDNQGQ